MNKGVSYHIKSALLGLAITISIHFFGIAFFSLTSLSPFYITLIIVKIITLIILPFKRFPSVAIGMFIGLIPVGIFTYYTYGFSFFLSSLKL